MKVGIVQNSVIYGGRLTVLAKIIELLNKKGIDPDIITYKTNISSEGIKEKYGIDASFNIRKVKSIFSRLPHETNIIVFGFTLRKIYREYDYFIDSNNTSFLMPPNIPIFSYIHFPRIARLKSRYISIYDPKGPKKKWTTKRGALLKVLSIFYSFHSLSKNNYLVSNSEFSRSYIKKYYPKYNKEIPIIYPPVDNNQNLKKTFGERASNISSLGRFCREKKQLEQIKLATKIPEWNLHLIGFSDECNDYLRYCREYASKNSIKNVFFHVNVSNKEKKELLNNSKFFIHTNINEPFGITTVEAILCGCVPLVHNSGGQKEIVPFDDLRFNSFDDLLGFFNNFNKSKKNYDVLVQKLIQYCKKNFGYNIFTQRFSNCLNYFEKYYL